MKIYKLVSLILVLTFSLAWGNGSFASETANDSALRQGNKVIHNCRAPLKVPYRGWYVVDNLLLRPRAVEERTSVSPQGTSPSTMGRPHIKAEEAIALRLIIEKTRMVKTELAPLLNEFRMLWAGLKKQTTPVSKAQLIQLEEKIDAVREKLNILMDSLDREDQLSMEEERYARALSLRILSANLRDRVGNQLSIIGNFCFVAANTGKMPGGEESDIIEHSLAMIDIITETILALSEVRICTYRKDLYLPGISSPDSVGWEEMRMGQSDYVNVRGGTTKWLSKEELVEFMKTAPVHIFKIPEGAARSRIEGLSSMLASHNRGIMVLEQNASVDLTSDIDLKAVNRLTHEEFSVIDFPHRDNSTSRVYVVYKNGALIGYGTYNFLPTETLRFTILEQRGAGNAYNALKLALRNMYYQHPNKELFRYLVVPEFSYYQGAVREYAWKSLAPLFFIRAGFEPIGATAHIKGEIRALRSNALGHTGKARLNEEVFSRRLVLDMNPAINVEQFLGSLRAKIAGPIPQKGNFQIEAERQLQSCV